MFRNWKVLLPKSSTGNCGERRQPVLLIVATVAAFSLMVGCGGNVPGVSQERGALVPAATPVISTTAGQSGAQLVKISDTTAGAAIYYTLDGSTPTSSSPQYFAPFLVTSSVTVKAVAATTGYTNSDVASQAVGTNVVSGTLVWSDEFSNATGANAQPNAAMWTYDTGNSGFGNSELETYCAWGSTASPCDTNNPNAYVGTDGYLHIVARKPSANVYTSARLKSQGLFSFQYGRIEARIKLPEGQGLWPAFWLLGNNIVTVNWPACGEQDVMEHINAPSPDWIQGSIHGTNLNDGQKYQPAGFLASDWHVYGMIWSKGMVQYYVDTPSNVYATFTNSGLAQGAVWPFDSDGNGAFVILNLAVGGSWPGSPDSTTPFPSEMLVDYVRVYAE
jgi:beta-glucanase (GH16 family)